MKKKTHSTGEENPLNRKRVPSLVEKNHSFFQKNLLLYRQFFPISSGEMLQIKVKNLFFWKKAFEFFSDS
ncbi:MAG: hypothetical protein K6C10_03255 [Prevotella sp.]|nr:hypothetical protein [Prevotella sp.]